jgi:DNA-binding response OmpR family regulator
MLVYIFSQIDKEFDIIILDSHIHNISSIEVARKIRDKSPNERIQSIELNSLTKSKFSYYYYFLIIEADKLIICN